MVADRDSGRKGGLNAGCFASSGSATASSYVNFTFPSVKRPTSPLINLRDAVSIQTHDDAQLPAILLGLAAAARDVRWARPGMGPRPGAIVIGTCKGEKPRRTVYLVRSVKNARVELTSGHRTRGVSVADIEPADANT
jgi:hypothetical protein